MNAVEPGESIGRAMYRPDSLALFLYGVAHWTAHKIHYDVEQARAEGNPGLLVVAQLMTAWQLELLSRWSGSALAIRSLTERNVGAAYAGDEVTVTGIVDRVDGDQAICTLTVTAGDRPVVNSEAVVELSRRR